MRMRGLSDAVTGAQPGGRGLEVKGQPKAMYNSCSSSLFNPMGFIGIEEQKAYIKQQWNYRYICDPYHSEP